MKVAVGETGTLEASFVDGLGAPIVLDAAPTIAFFDEDGDPVGDLTATTPVQISAALWRATFDVLDDFTLGWYRAVWSAESEDVPMSGSEFFEIVESGVVVIADPEWQLRRKLADLLPEGTVDDSNAFFTNEEIHSLLAMYDSNITRAAYEGWQIKMATLAYLVDIDESGSSRQLSQRFRAARDMVALYGKLVAGLDGSDAGRIRALVHGRVASLRRDPMDVLGVRASPFQHPEAQHVRIYPLKRFPAVYA